MEIFNELEKRAILQCFWQLLSAKPSKDENEFITKITSDWSLSQGGWVYEAIQQEPYSSFNCIANMNEEKKNEFKKMVISIVEYKGNNDYKTQMAVALFNKTKIPYAITGRDILIYNENNNGRYQIL